MRKIKPTPTKEMQDEKQISQEEFDWGEEIPEDWEDEEECEEEFPREKLLSATLDAANPMVIVPQVPGYSVTFKHVAFGSENKTETRHIIEVISDDTAGEKFVLARLVPNYCEALSLDLRVPPVKQLGQIKVCLTGEGELGPVDLVVLMEKEGETEECDSECSSCCHEDEEESCEEKACCHGQCKSCPNAQKCCGESNEAIKTLQQQKEEMLKAREAKKAEQIPKPETKKEEGKPFNPFEKKAVEEKKPVEEKKSKEEPKKEEPKKEEPKQKKEKIVPEFRNFKGVQIKDVVVGYGPEAKHGKKLKVSYVLHLNNENGKILDSSRNKKFDFKLGAGQVISGWDIGVAGMKVGGKRVLIVPPRLGYGGQRQGSVPANATLCFEIELFNVM